MYFASYLTLIFAKKIVLEYSGKKCQESGFSGAVW